MWESTDNMLLKKLNHVNGFLVHCQTIFNEKKHSLGLIPFGSEFYNNFCAKNNCLLYNPAN